MIPERASTRTTSTMVRFAHAFHLGSDPGELPPGSYVVHTHEDVYESALDPVYIMAEVELVVEAPGRRSSRIVNPAVLQAALKQDAARSDLIDQSSENPDLGKYDPSVTESPIADR